MRYKRLRTSRRERAARRSRRGRTRVPRPPTLSDWLGKGALKPPAGKLKAPTFAPLKKLFPPSLPDGKPYARKTPPPSHLEKLAPPDEQPLYERWLEKDDNRGRKDEPHWHINGRNTPFLHAGKSWGRADRGRWTWMIKSDRRWWTVADGAQRMVRHRDRWWWKTRDGWFLLHEGRPWVWRYFAEWRRRGYLQPKSGTAVVYSADGRRVALITPGQGARVFDARTGGLLGSYPEKRARNRGK